MRASGIATLPAALTLLPSTFPAFRVFSALQNYVEWAEDAAACLRALARRDAVFDDVKASPLLDARLRHALADCVLPLERLRPRL